MEAAAAAAVALVEPGSLRAAAAAAFCVMAPLELRQEEAKAISGVLGPGAKRSATHL